MGSPAIAGAAAAAAGSASPGTQLGRRAGVELALEQPDERVPGSDALQHRQARPIVVETQLVAALAARLRGPRRAGRDGACAIVRGAR